MKLTLQQRIIVNLATLTRDYSPTTHVLDHRLTGIRREAEAVRIGAANARGQRNAQGWFATPKLGSDMQRSRAVKTLLSDGLLEADGRGRGRVVRLTEAGHAAAAQLMEGLSDE